MASSGDNGAAGSATRCTTDSGSGNADWTGSSSWSGEGYFPSFPASSPYVTAVGATMGGESGNADIACQSQEGGGITTGGGFSTYYPTPDWQKSAVDGYFAGLTGANTPTSGYNRNGRGYPDISFTGVNYQVVIQTAVYGVYGTSASAPLFGAMVSLLNAARAGSNLAPVGFINPTLYAYGMPNTFGGNGTTNFNPFNDITSGNTKCMAEDNGNVDCCDSGFTATAGWDPVTGWGSTYYPKLAQMMAVEVDYNPGGGGSKSESFTSSETIIVIVFVIVTVVPIIAGFIYFMWGGGGGGSSASRPARGQAVPSVEVHVPPPAEFRLETY